MSDEKLKKEVRTEVDKAIETYGKAKKEIPQLGWGGVIGQKDFARGLADAFRSPYDIARGSMNMLKSAFKPTKVSALPTDSTDSHERFLFAKEYYGLEENDIKERVKASCLIFYMALIGSIVDLLIYFYISWTSGNLLTLAILPTLSLFMWLVVQCFKYGLINYQMRKEALCPAKEYLKDNEHWFPPLSGGGKLVTFLIVSIPMFMFASSAYAAGEVSDTCSSVGNAALSISVEKVLSIPCSKDMWLQSLARIFPNVGPLADVQTGVAQTYGVGFVAALAAFVAILNAVAVGSLSYQSCIAVINTAVEGDTMGQKWHKVWAPVRICYGFGMLAPITKGGVCMAQVFVLYIALWSGNWANLVYNSYLYGISNPTKVDSSYIPPNTVNTLSALVQLNICWSVQQHSALGAGNSSSEWANFSPNYTENAQREHGGSLSGISNLYDYEQYRWDFNECGYLESKKQNDRLDTLSNVSTSAGGISAPVSIIAYALSLDPDEKSFFRARAEAITELNGVIHTTIDDIIGPMLDPQSGDNLVAYKDPFEDKLKKATDPGGPIDQAFKKYNDAVVSAASTLMQSNGEQQVFDAFKKTITDNGWMLAGAYYMTTSRMSDQLAKTMKDEPRTGFVSGDDSKLDSALISRLNEPGKKYFDHISQKFSQMYGQIGIVDESTAVGAAKNASRTGQVLNYNLSLNGVVAAFRRGGFQAGWDYTCNGLQYITFSALDSMTSVEPGTGSAFQQMIDFGHDLIDIGEIFFALASLFQMFGPVIKAMAKLSHWWNQLAFIASVMGGQPETAIPSAIGSGVSSFIEKNTSGVIQMIVGAAIAALGLGATYAYIFPMLPYINFLFFEQGTLALVAECMIAAPILAYLHVRGEGEQLVDQVQKTGYLILFNLFLRIPLGVFGLILSVALFETCIWLNSIMFKVAMNATIASNASGPIGTFVFIFLTLYIEWSLALKSFSIISTMPEKIARWFGAATESHGEAQGMREMLAFGVAQISNRAQGFVGKQINSMASGSGGSGSGGGKTPTTPGSSGGGKGGGKTPSLPGKK